MNTRRNFIKTSAGLSLIATAGAPNFFVPRTKGASALIPANEKIEGARNVALSILKPTAKQLEHGMEVHTQSVVFDSYGFAPRSAVDGEAFDAAVASGATDGELTDLREEMMMTRCATDAREREEFLQAFRAAGVTCIFQNAGEEGNDPLRLLKFRASWEGTATLPRF